MSNDVPNLSVGANSRLPVLGRDYNDKSHRYTSTYINPGQFVLGADAFPGTDLIETIPPEPGANETIRIERLKVPSDTVAFVFSVTLIAGNRIFKRSRSNPISSLTGTERFFNQKRLDGPWTWNVAVPVEGTYEVSVQLRNRSGKGPKSTRRITVEDFLIVSIGDSAASGQGNPDVPGTPKGFELDIKWWEIFIPPLLLFEIGKAGYEAVKNKFKQKFTTAARASGWTLDMDPQPIWLEKKAYRSLRSGPALAARRLENTASGTLISFLSFARTGSEIQAGLLGPRTDGGKPIDAFIGNIGQVQEVRNTLGRRRIDALLITVGVNDIGVAGTLKDLVINDNKWLGKTGGDATVAREQAISTAKKKLDQLPTHFDALETALRTLNIRHIYLTEYPTALFDRENGKASKGCGIFSSDFFDLNLDEDDAGRVKDLAVQLNDKLRMEAQKRGWFFISGIADGFRGRGYCTNDRVRCFVQAEESMINQGDTEGTIHPNAAGHSIYAKQIADMVKRNTIDKGDVVKIVSVQNRSSRKIVAKRRKPASK